MHNALRIDTMSNENSNKDKDKNKNMTPTQIAPIWDGSYVYNPVTKTLVAVLFFPLTAGGTFEVQTSSDSTKWTTTSTQQPSVDTSFSASLSLKGGIGIRVMQVA